MNNFYTDKPTFALRDNSKIPATPNGFLDALVSGKPLPLGNYGMPTGTTSGIFVVDIDAGHGGFDSLTKLGGLPTTFTVNTPSGGIHLYYKHEDGFGNAVGIVKGIDLRGDGGYVVIPASEIDGTPYEVSVDMELAPIPDKIKKLIESKSSSRVSPESDGTVISGGRNDYLFNRGIALHKSGLSGKAVFKALQEENLERCNPPLPEKEVDLLFKSLTKYEVPESEEEELCVSPKDLVDEMFTFMSNPDQVSGLSTGIAGLDGLLGGGLRLGEIVAVTAPAKTGKSTLIHYIMHQMLKQGTQVGYLSREMSPATEVLPNLLDIEFKLNALNSPVKTTAYRNYLNSIPLTFARGYGYISLDDMRSWITHLKQRGCDFFILDHLHYSLHNSEDFQEASKVIKQIKTMCKDLNICFIVIIQPVKLQEGQQQGINSLRGGAALGQAVDCVITIQRRHGMPGVIKVEMDAIRHRNGKLGHIFLDFDNNTRRFQQVKLERIEGEVE